MPDIAFQLSIAFNFCARQPFIDQHITERFSMGNLAQNAATRHHLIHFALLAEQRVVDQRLVLGVGRFESHGPARFRASEPHGKANARLVVEFWSALVEIVGKRRNDELHIGCSITIIGLHQRLGMADPGGQRPAPAKDEIHPVKQVGNGVAVRSQRRLVDMKAHDDRRMLLQICTDFGAFGHHADTMARQFIGRANAGQEQQFGRGNGPSRKHNALAGAGFNFPSTL